MKAMLDLVPKVKVICPYNYPGEFYFFTRVGAEQWVENVKITGEANVQECEIIEDDTLNV